MFSSVSRNLFKKAMQPKRLTALTWRGIKLHEYQAAQLLKSYGVPVPNVRLFPPKFCISFLCEMLTLSFRAQLLSTWMRLEMLPKEFIRKQAKDA
jgi:hypothetical protein